MISSSLKTNSAMSRRQVPELASGFLGMVCFLLSSFLLLVRDKPEVAVNGFDCFFSLVGGRIEIDNRLCESLDILRIGFHCSNFITANRIAIILMVNMFQALYHFLEAFSHRIAVFYDIKNRFFTSCHTLLYPFCPKSRGRGEEMLLSSQNLETRVDRHSGSRHQTPVLPTRRYR